MKTKELIRLLQQEDPSGEENVCVGNVDISHVYKEPAYWDGPAQLVIRDEKGYPVGGKYCRKGHKIQIRTITFSDLIWDRKDFKVDYSELDEERQQSYKENHAKIRKAGMDCDYDLELENFVEWAKKKAKLLIDEDITKVAKEFFDANLNPYIKIPDDIPIIGESYMSRKQIQWDRELEVSYDGDFCIKRKELR